MIKKHFLVPTLNSLQVWFALFGNIFSYVGILFVPRFSILPYKDFLILSLLQQTDLFNTPKYFYPSHVNIQTLNTYASTKISMSLGDAAPWIYLKQIKGMNDTNLKTGLLHVMEDALQSLS